MQVHLNASVYDAYVDVDLSDQFAATVVAAAVMMAMLQVDRGIMVSRFVKPVLFISTGYAALVQQHRVP